MSQSITPGGYSAFEKLTAETEKVFHEALSHLIGVKYVPLLVSTQVVAGTNFLYICNATPVYPNAATYGVEVLIFRPLQGSPHVISIKRLP